ncbi:cytochrome c oxidase assembly factor 1 homolog [Ahaetulla prasina]|uniref:cytochrome c oxidase assembly factor 1 homolog n=1 Tax=Ahaetulla prasina TaxID=499056 RepID=UPI0026496B57|nr:cytochrome c oxidase assembly factor 1 homolog [Ahaetulla prasina]XP_058037867.1 cytochrome c oxidase assembly factor 1 homolog [Ahaetulla prasina]XP_058037868.1 cytochrome c oxidase assembly factor 1 homolog [Ahaetulla prasina]
MSLRKFHQMALFMGIQCIAAGAFTYYYVQRVFSRTKYYQDALKHLQADPIALEALGAPPLKVHYISLRDKSNRVDKSTAQVKIPVSGKKSGGYLHVNSEMDFSLNSWSLQEVTLQLCNGHRIPVYVSSMKTISG